MKSLVLRIFLLKNSIINKLHIRIMQILYPFSFLKGCNFLLHSQYKKNVNKYIFIYFHFILQMQNIKIPPWSNNIKDNDVTIFTNICMSIYVVECYKRRIYIGVPCIVQFFSHKNKIALIRDTFITAEWYKKIQFAACKIESNLVSL